MAWPAWWQLRNNLKAPSGSWAHSQAPHAPQPHSQPTPGLPSGPLPCAPAGAQPDAGRQGVGAQRGGPVPGAGQRLCQLGVGGGAAGGSQAERLVVSQRTMHALQAAGRRPSRRTPGAVGALCMLCTLRWREHWRLKELSATEWDVGGAAFVASARARYCLGAASSQQDAQSNPAPALAVSPGCGAMTATRRGAPTPRC